MPYGYDQGFQEAGAAVQGIGQNMSHVALAVARMKYLRAAQEQRQALAVARLAMQQATANTTQQRNLATADKSQMDAAMTERKMSVANQLGMATAQEQGMRGVPSVEDIASGGGPTLKGVNLGDMVRKASVAGLQMQSRGLAGKTSDPYALHNIPEGGTAVNPFGDVMAVGQPKTFSPEHEKSSFAGLYRSAANFIERTQANVALTGDQSALKTPEYQQAVRIVRTAPALIMGKDFGQKEDMPQEKIDQTGGSPDQQPKAGGGQPVYARNKKTGERIMSDDGGNTWKPVR